MIPVLSFGLVVGAAASGRYLRRVHSTQGRHCATGRSTAVTFADLHAAHAAASEGLFAEWVREARADRGLVTA
jgi:hypothetical protein